VVVGVDFDSFKATLCVLPFAGGAPLFAEARWRWDSDRGEALTYLGRVHDDLLHALDELGRASERFRSEMHLCFVERGFGASRRSDFILGAYLGAIYATLAGGWEYPYVVNLLDAREWKREVTAASGIGQTKAGKGNPNAKKDVANEACRALLLLDEIDATDWTADMLDAWGIAYTGRRLNQHAIAA
jgi:hypothetical protein